jgi:hypothetical protein
VRRDLPLLILLSLAVQACLVELDTERPIYLVPAAEDGWTARQVQQIAEAGECWNLEFGTRLVMDPDPPPDAQQVPFYLSDLACPYVAGLVHPVDGVEVHICPLHPRFSTLVHELGHVVNIHVHAGDEWSVMSEASVTSYFSEEDRRLFYEANPGYVGQGPEAMTHRLGRGRFGPWAIGTRSGAVAVWQGDGELRYAVPGADGAPRRQGAIPVHQGLDILHVFAAPGGPGVLWIAREQRYRHYVSVVDPAAGGMSRLVQLRPDLDPVELIVSAAVHRGAPVTLVRNFLDGTVTVQRVDLATGRRSASVLELGDDFQALGELDQALELLTSGDELLLLGSDKTGFTLYRLDSEGRRVLGRHRGAGSRARLALATRDAVYLTAGEDTDVELIRLASGSLTETRRRELGPPGRSDWLFRLHLLATPGGLVATTSTVDKLYETEVHAALIDPLTLALEKPWRRISAPDGARSTGPVTVRVRGRTIAVWEETFLFVPSAYKSRLVRF